MGHRPTLRCSRGDAPKACARPEGEAGGCCTPGTPLLLALALIVTGMGILRLITTLGEVCNNVP